MNTHTEKERSGYSTAPSTSRPAQPMSARVKKSSISQRTAPMSASIPYKFMTKIIDVPRMKAFGLTSKRFTYRNELNDAEQPGPGEYNLYRESLWKDNKQSNSRIGYGRLASRVYRINKTQELYNTGPGPGAYMGTNNAVPEHSSFHNSDSMKKKYEKSKSAVRLGSHTARAKRSGLVDAPTTGTIGPGYYEVERYEPKKVKNLSGIAFISASNREKPDQEQLAHLQVPSSWDYNIPREVVAHHPTSNKGTSAFVEPSGGRLLKYTDYGQIRNIVTAKNPINSASASTKPTPGPGAYNVTNSFESLAGMRYPTVKEVFSVTSPQKSSFQTNANPGPGRYEIESPFNVPKEIAVSSPFMSETVRRAFNVTPATGIWSPFTPIMTLSRKEFNKNRKKHWI